MESRDDVHASPAAPGRRSVEVAPDKFAYIDAVRGWAILMVMTSHVGGLFAELPWPVKKLTNFGWHGVQLFFLASAITLFFSWHRGAAPFGHKAKNFFIRRFLRIAPMYYFGALLYFVMWPPGENFSLAQLLRTLLFVNAWNPGWIPTDGGWMVVPGGWSIGVEFTFYAIFPVLVVFITNLPRAIALFAISVPVAVLLNYFGLTVFNEFHGTALENFLYFWFPNQLPVFALGVVLYYLIVQWPTFQLNHSLSIIAIGIIGFMGVFAALNPAASDRFSFDGPSQILIVAIILALFVMTLAKSNYNIFVHPIIQRIGVLSFGCYVLHFLFVHGIPAWSGGLIDTSASGIRAILMVGVLWLLVVPATVVAAALAHRLIEQPGIRLAQRLTRRRVARTVAAE